MTNAMEVETALKFADEWTVGHDFYKGVQGWRVVCATLAAEVRRLRELEKGHKRYEYVRLLNPRQYEELCHRALTGDGATFDGMVDELVEKFEKKREAQKTEKV